MPLLSAIANNAFPIRTVAAMAGINPATLRTGERRYHLSQPQVPVFVGGWTSVILDDVTGRARATALGMDSNCSFRRIAAQSNDGSRPSAADKNKNTIKQTSQENTCRSQV